MRDSRVQVLSVVTVGGRVINSRHLEGPYGIRLQGPQKSHGSPVAGMELGCCSFSVPPYISLKEQSFSSY